MGKAQRLGQPKLYRRMQNHSKTDTSATTDLYGHVLSGELDSVRQGQKPKGPSDLESLTTRVPTLDPRHSRPGLKRSLASGQMSPQPRPTR